MKKVTLAIAIFGLVWFCVSCGKQDHASPDVSAKTTDEEIKICREHGVPENECTRCNPSLIPAFKAKGDWCEEHGLPESQCAICNPALAGRVLVSSESETLAGIKTEKVKVQSLSSQVSATGKIQYNERRLTHITSRVSGRIEEVYAFLYSKVEEGAPLVSLYSPEYLSAQSEYVQAEERLKRPETANDPEEEATARAICQSAKQKLLIMGVPEKEIVKLEEVHLVQPYLTVRAPFSGTVVESNVIQGNYVDPPTNLYKLADLSTVWTMVDVYEKDIAEVRSGQVAQITVPIYPDEVFNGKVESIGDVLDETTRTFKVRVVLTNLRGKLKPEMFVKVLIITGNNSTLTIPKSAVLMDGEKNIVFASSDDHAYFRKEVQLGKETDGFVQIISGLNPDENVVIEGNFLLKSELFKSKLGAGCAE